MKIKINCVEFPFYKHKLVNTSDSLIFCLKKHIEKSQSVRKNYVQQASGILINKNYLKLCNFASDFSR